MKLAGTIYRIVRLVAPFVPAVAIIAIASSMTVAVFGIVPTSASAEVAALSFLILVTFVVGHIDGYETGNEIHGPFDDGCI